MKKFIVPIIVLSIALIAGSIFVISNKSSNDSFQPNMQSGSTIKDGKLTADDVAQHDSSDDCWTIINGQVYDITSYIRSHPGGSVIEQACGVDGTKLFNTQGGEGSHSASADAILADFKIGELQN